MMTFNLYHANLYLYVLTFAHQCLSFISFNRLNLDLPFCICLCLSVCLSGRQYKPPDCLCCINLSIFNTGHSLGKQFSWKRVCDFFYLEFFSETDIFLPHIFVVVDEINGKWNGECILLKHAYSVHIHG